MCYEEKLLISNCIMFMFKTNEPIKVIYLQKLASESMLNDQKQPERRDWNRIIANVRSDSFEFALNLLQKHSIGTSFGKWMHFWI